MLKLHEQAILLVVFLVGVVAWSQVQAEGFAFEIPFPRTTLLTITALVFALFIYANFTFMKPKYFVRKSLQSIAVLMIIGLLWTYFPITAATTVLAPSEPSGFALITTLFVLGFIIAMYLTRARYQR